VAIIHGQRRGVGLVSEARTLVKRRNPGGYALATSWCVCAARSRQGPCCRHAWVSDGGSWLLLGSSSEWRKEVRCSASRLIPEAKRPMVLVWRKEGNGEEQRLSAFSSAVADERGPELCIGLCTSGGGFVVCLVCETKADGGVSTRDSHATDRGELGCDAVFSFWSGPVKLTWKRVGSGCHGCKRNTPSSQLIDPEMVLTSHCGGTTSAGFGVGVFGSLGQLGRREGKATGPACRMLDSGTCG
jgi:hypothetical protein